MDKLEYKHYLTSPWWYRVSAKRKAIDGFKCRECNSAERLEVHHLSYERLGHERSDDLITLCMFCHEDKHPEVA